MLYQFYVTYICCVILNNVQIHFKASRTYIHIHKSIVFGHFLLHMHYSMAPPGLDPEVTMLRNQGRNPNARQSTWIVATRESWSVFVIHVTDIIDKNIDEVSVVRVCDERTQKNNNVHECSITIRMYSVHASWDGFAIDVCKTVTKYDSLWPNMICPE